MLPICHKSHLRPWQLLANPRHLPRLRPRVKAPMQKERRHSDFPQLTVIQIFIRPLHRIRQPKPSRTISSQSVGPLRLPVILRQQLFCLFAQISRVRSKSFKEYARSRLPPKQMECLQNQAFASLRRCHSDHRADHRPIAMSPKRRLLDAQPVEKRDRLRRRSPVKIQRHFFRNPRRVPIPRAVRNQYPEFFSKGGDLPIEWIDPISPAAMQKNQRSAPSKFPVMDRDRAYLRRMRRTNQLKSRQESRLAIRAVHKILDRFFRMLTRNTLRHPPPRLKYIPTARHVYHDPRRAVPVFCSAAPITRIPKNKNGWQLSLPAASNLATRI